MAGIKAKGFLLISTPLLFSFLMLAVPLAMMLALSFWTQDYLTINRDFSLDNYREAASEPVYRHLLFRSLGIAFVTTMVTIALAFPMAYFISFYGGRRKGLWLFLITIPFWTSYLLRIFLWKVILGYNGVLNSGLYALSLIEEPLTFILYNVNAVVIALSHGWAPFAILPIFVALEKIDRSLFEAARDLGSSAVRIFMKITLPLAAPGIIAALMIVFIPTVGDYITPRLVGGTDGLMIANMVQVQFVKANNAPLGAALAVLTMLSVAIIAIVFMIVSRRWLRRML